MALFSRKSNAEKEVEQLKQILATSFSNVKRDSQNIFEWLNFLYKKNQHQEQIITELKQQLDHMPKTRQELKQIIDYYYSHDHLLKKIHELNERVDSLIHLKNMPFELDQIRAQLDNLAKIPRPIPAHVEQNIAHIRARLDKVESATPIHPIVPHHIEEKLSQMHSRLEKVEAKKQSFKEKLVQKIAKRSKEYVKSVIISYIRKYGKISGLQLKEMVVDEQALCSKSSFYRLLNEIESLGEISVIQQGKEKQYLFKITKLH